MKRVCGLMLFCFGAGMAILLFIPATIMTILFIIACMVRGYNLFCWERVFVGNGRDALIPVSS